MKTIDPKNREPIWLAGERIVIENPAPKGGRTLSRPSASSAPSSSNKTPDQELNDRAVETMRAEQIPFVDALKRVLKADAALAQRYFDSFLQDL